MWNETMASIGRVIHYPLFTLGGTKVSLGTILTAAVVIALAALISWLVRRATRRIFLRGEDAASRSVSSVNRLIHYAILLVGIGIALQTAGFNLNALFAAGAVFAVAIGFAMQNIVQNFVAGVILLAERAIKPGDVLEVEKAVVKVLSLGIRTTVVLTRDGENLIVPNSVLVQSTVKNYTLKDASYRVRAAVGVTYGSDLRLVRATLEETAAAIAWRLAGHEPIVILTEFGSSSVDYEVGVWIDTPWTARQSLSELHEAIWWALKEKGIVIAFPQLDVHVDPPVEESLRRLASVR